MKNDDLLENGCGCTFLVIVIAIVAACVIGALWVLKRIWMWL